MSNLDFLDDHFISTVIGGNKENDEKNEVEIIDKALSGGVVSAGGNFFSEILQLSIKYKENGGEVKDKYFIIKLFSTAVTYDLGKAGGIYDKEMEMYANVLPEIMKLLNENEHVMFPISYKSIYPDVLVLEDLRKIGYKTSTRSKSLDYDHCIIAIKALAKFHGLSVKVKQSNPDIMKNVSNDSLFAMIDADEGSFDRAFTCFVDVVNEIPDTKPYANSIKKLGNTIVDNCKDLLKAKDDVFSVLNHGDYWLSNMMFKYDENGKVEKVKMFDFQLTRWSSPVTDIWFFVLTSMSVDVFKEHFNDILSIYLEILNKTIGDDEKYTLEKMKDDFNNSILFAISISATLLPVFLGSTDQNVQEISERGDRVPDADTMKKIYRGQRYVEAIKYYIPYFSENYLHK